MGDQSTTRQATFVIRADRCRLNQHGLFVSYSIEGEGGRLPGGGMVAGTDFAAEKRSYERHGYTVDIRLDNAPPELIAAIDALAGDTISL